MIAQLEPDLCQEAPHIQAPPMNIVLSNDKAVGWIFQKLGQTGLAHILQHLEIQIAYAHRHVMDQLEGLIHLCEGITDTDVRLGRTVIDLKVPKTGSGSIIMDHYQSRNIVNKPALIREAK